MIKNNKVLIVNKKDGRKQEYNGNKIEIAVEKAYKALLMKGIRSKEEYEEAIFDKDVPKRIRFSVELDLLKKKEPIDYKFIHDCIERELSNYDFEACKEYILYRNKREVQRERINLLEEKKNIIESFSDRASNANLDENTFSGKESVILEKRMEQMALYTVLPENLSNLHLTRELYYHDLPKFALGQHNCSYADFDRLLHNGMSVGQGDIKPPKHFEPMMQLLAVIIQLQSQIQFGGCAIAALDFLVQEYLEYLIRDLLIETLDILGEEKEIPERVKLSEVSNYIDKKQEEILLKRFKRQIHQSCEALITNLVTLQSRAGGQLPFSSINLGLNLSDEAMIFNRIFLEELDNGIGRKHKTAVFPITCYQVKKGFNRYPEDKGYEIYQYALEVTCRRHYPTIVNCNWSVYPESNDPYKQHFRMG